MVPGDASVRRTAYGKRSCTVFSLPFASDPAANRLARGAVQGRHKRTKTTSSKQKDLPRRRRPRLLLLGAAIIVVLAGCAIAGIKMTMKISGTASADFKCSATGSRATNRVTVTGAARNGSADDFDAIQNAIDMAGSRGGGIVALPACTFIVNRHLVLKNNVELTGAGPATIIKAGPGFMATEGPGGGYPIISTAGASDVTITHLTADQSGNMLDGNVAARLSGYVVESRSSHNVVIDGVYTRNPFTYSIAIVASSSFCVENSNVQVTPGDHYNQLDGIHILDSSFGQVINNTVQSGDDGLVAHTISGSVHDVLYANNKVHGGTYADGIQLAVGNFPIYNIKIEDNDFYGSLLGIGTGYYDNGTGAVHNITITGNYIYNLNQGGHLPAIGIGGQGPITNITVTNNHTCNAGPVTVEKGPGNAVTGTTGCTS